jgi:hypothetical protein
MVEYNNMEFAIKIVFRATHITCASILIGLTFGETVLGLHSPHYALVHPICGVLLLIAGIVNMVLLAPEKNMGHLSGRWRTLMKCKMALYLIFLPWPEYVAKKLGMTFPRSQVSQVATILVILLSVYAKQYRDWAVLQKANKN